MSKSEDRDSRLTRDDVEGTYTQHDDEAPEARQVAGQYTEAGGDGPDGTVVGTYIGSERDGEEPLVRDAKLRHGDYPRSERRAEHEEER
ncbi:hypothetical protein GCM10027406_13590 [Leifsonia lichenia]